MIRRILFALPLLLSSTLTFADDHELEEVAEAPKGLSPAIAKLINPEGHRIASDDGPVVDLWLLKDVALKTDFKPTLSRMYAFEPGQLIGAIRVGEGADFTDFRGQEMHAGTYTLRYALQPTDGNHVGTSDTSDFLLALPADIDKRSDSIKSFEDLSKLSAKAARATHPAIFSLLDPKKVRTRPKLEEDDSSGHWILGFRTKGKEGDKSVTLKVRLIVIGEAEA